jgi:hypothetical protein
MSGLGMRVRGRSLIGWIQLGQLLLREQTLSLAQWFRTHSKNEREAEIRLQTDAQSDVVCNPQSLERAA